MRILFTGASSFTGFWFVSALAEAGHEVVATFRGQRDDYEGVRRTRIERLADRCRAIHGCAFGDDTFLQVLGGESRWDLLCHHAADVTDYKSVEFDVGGAVRGNTLHLDRILTMLTERECRRVLLTGSIFEPGEGAGSEGLPAFSPYGVSKAATAEVFAFHCRAHDLRLGKFVIPNPFGAYEEPRFTRYLIRSWLDGKTPAVNTPAYVRDNIHVSLLARAYADFAERLPAAAGFCRCNPSGYVETQGAFARRVGEAMETRLGVPCAVELLDQVVFSEPRIRINTEPALLVAPDWNESEAWDEMARFYLEGAGIVGSSTG